MSAHDEEFHPLQERDRIAIGWIAALALVVCGAGIASVAVEWMMLRAEDRAAHVAPATGAPYGPVEFSPIWDSERGITLEAQQRASLERLEWVDRDAGIARIPIERAMDLVIDAGVTVGSATPETPSLEAGAP
jgi:hypothetical protein